MERRSLSLREIAMLFTLLLNFSGLVWGAAKLSDTVESLETTVSELNSTVKRLTIDLVNIQIDYNARIKVLEDRVGRR